MAAHVVGYVYTCQSTVCWLKIESLGAMIVKPGQVMAIGEDHIVTVLKAQMYGAGCIMLDFFNCP